MTHAGIDISKHCILGGGGGLEKRKMISQRIYDEVYANFLGSFQPLML